MSISYNQSHDRSISDALKRRFWKDVATLEDAGFRFFSMHQEVIWPFSVILFFPVYVMMAANEEVRVESPLRITSYHLLYVSKDEATFAYVYGLGCKFHTKFTDGTWLVSNTAQKTRNEKVVVQKRIQEGVSTQQVLKNHDAKVQQLQASGLQPVTRLTFDDWVSIDSQFNQDNLISLAGTGLVWLVILAGTIYLVVTSAARIIDVMF
jgi:hypothetical protein